MNNSSAQQDLKDLKKLHHILKEVFPVPFTKTKRFGWSTMFTILPGGSTVTFFMRSKYIFTAHRHKMPRNVKNEMYRKMFMDWILGAPPIIGSVITYFYNADGKIYTAITNELQNKTQLDSEPVINSIEPASVGT